MAFDTDTLAYLHDALHKLNQGFAGLPEYQIAYDQQRVAEVLDEVTERLQDNFPFHHPLYAGQMLKPPHPVARSAYQLATWINPNNHALDGGRASSVMEKDAVAQIAAMFGFAEHLGHLTSGGTFANLEALWVAGQINPGKTIVGSAQAHYTHGRICAVLGLHFESLPVDAAARMDVAALEQRLQAGDVGTVVVTLGTTGVGAVDPLAEVLALRARFGFRLHVDAAYGGYFGLTDELIAAVAPAYRALDQVDSLVIDPHKHGLQPYGCGCILFRDPSVGAFYRHDSPYTYFSSDDLHLGEISLECSRAGASAVALWATMRLLPLERNGEFAQDLARSLNAGRQLYQRLADDPRYIAPLHPDLDIVIWAPRAASSDQVSRLSQQLFERCAAQGLHLAVFSCPTEWLSRVDPSLQVNGEHTVVLRSCLMKPEHLDWLDRIWQHLDEAYAAVCIK